MKRKVIAALLVGAALVGCKEQAAEAPAAEPLALDSDVAKVSYGMGLSLGAQIQREGFEVQMDAFAAGMSAAMKGEDPLLSDEELALTMQKFQQEQMAKRQAEAEALAADNLKASEEFLAANATKEGVSTTESGLQYKVITAGEGSKPTNTDTVEVHYRGTLVDGTEFDSSYSRNSTVTFPVNGVIPGWTEALQMMPVGSKWELYIPSDLAYGPGGTQGLIGPNAALVFEVELISIVEPEQG